MTLIRWAPLNQIAPWHPMDDLGLEFTNMQREIDRIFDRVRTGARSDEQSSFWIPAVDIIEREKDYFVKVELPGVSKDDVKITAKNDVLTVRGEKKMELEKKEDNFHRIERSYGTFQRSFTLPSSVISDKIEASYDNGILTITLPKIEETKPKEIEVKVK